MLERDNFTKEELSAIRVLFYQMVADSNEDDLGVILKSGCWHHLPHGDDAAIVQLADKLRATPEELDTLAIARRRRVAAGLPVPKL
jgi:hypothetical protein